jgi:iron complex outermembrane receptor protein
MNQRQLHPWIGSWLLLVSCGALFGADAATPVKPAEPDFVAMSLEDLGAIKVTSVSKKAEPLSGVAAAVSVITSDDIRRSGALNLPEALRLAPGVDVAQVDASQWAVSIRGFNGTYSQKLLVLMDGRSVYTPLFAGTFWQAQDILLEDVDRIEVIRGPGGSVWGANAVNGVINIVSKPARETQGLLLTGGGGSELLVLAGVRYGVQLGTNTFFRLYGKYDDWNNSQLVTGGDANDAWWKGQGGFRLDWEPSLGDRFTLQGDMFGLSANQTDQQLVRPIFGVPPPPTGYTFPRSGYWDQSGGNLLGRWTHQFSEESDFSVQTYYDRSNLESPALAETRDTYDLDLRHRFQLGARQEIVWGGGYRLSQSKLDGSVEVNLSRTSRSDQVGNLFVQDEIQLVPDRLRLTLGTKLEHNDYTGFEFEPGTRLAWTPTDKQTVWASVARAVRTPSQIERDARFNVAVLPPFVPTLPPTLVSVNGNPDFASETLIAYELGYRIQAHRRLTLDVAAFVNDYDNLRAYEDRLDFSALPNYLQAQSQLNNNAHGLTYGSELTATWQVADMWRLQGLFSALQADLSAPPNSRGVPQTPVIAAPAYQASLRSSMNLGQRVDLDAWVRYVDGIASAGTDGSGPSRGQANIPSYVTFDLRLAWRPTRRLELALVGQNLAGSHREFNPVYTQPTEVSRSIFGKLTWKF